MSYLLGVDKIDTTTRIENSDGSTIELIRVAAKVVVANKADNFLFERNYSSSQCTSTRAIA